MKKDYDLTKTEVGRLTQVVGDDQNSGMQKDMCGLKTTVYGNPVEKITGLVPDFKMLKDDTEEDIKFVKNTGIAVVSAIFAIIGIPLLYLLGNHPELLAQLFRAKSGVQ